MGYLKEGRRGVMSLMGLFRAADAEGAIPPAEAAARADIFLAVNASSVELVDVERYCTEWVGERPLVLWNFELDTLRSDLGASPTVLVGKVFEASKGTRFPRFPMSLTITAISVGLVSVERHCAEQKGFCGVVCSMYRVGAA